MQFLRYFLLTIFALNLGNSFAMEENLVKLAEKIENSVLIEKFERTLETRSIGKNREIINSLINHMIKNCASIEDLANFIDNKGYKKYFDTYLMLEFKDLSNKPYEFLIKFYRLLILNGIPFCINYFHPIFHSNSALFPKIHAGEPMPVIDALNDAIEIERKCLVQRTCNLPVSLANIAFDYEQEL